MKKLLVCLAILSMTANSMNVQAYEEKNEYTYLSEEEASTYVTNSGLVITTKKQVVMTKSGNEIIQTVTESGNRMVKGYYSSDDSIMIQEYYRDGILVRTLDLNKRSISNYIDDRVTEETDVGWGYSYENGRDERSYSCPQYYVTDGYYDRRNIEIYIDEAVDEQDEFADAVYRIQSAEKKLKREIGTAKYNTVIDVIGEITSASYNDLIDAVLGVKNYFDTIEMASDVYDLGEIIAENGVGLFELYDEMAYYDHL